MKLTSEDIEVSKGSFFTLHLALRRSCRNTKGITLVEMMIVVIIIGLMATVTLPHLHRPLLNYQLDATARDMASQIRLVRMRSINGEANQVRFVVVPSRNSYEIWQTGLIIEKITALPSGISFGTSLTQTLTFSDTGAASSGFPDVLIRNSYGDTLCLAVLPTTGRVRVTRE
jgi:prepilin-type N-terminal cleavage/methylation domain-containing protein